MFTLRKRLTTFVNHASVPQAIGVLAIVFAGTLASLVPLTGPSVHASSAPTVIAKKLLDAKTAINTTTNATVGSSYMSQCRESAIYVDWSTSISAGAVTIESAVDENYTGTWAPLIVVTYASGSPKQDIVQITGVHWAIRTRISTAMTGGTVSTWIVCN